MQLSMMKKTGHTLSSSPTLAVEMVFNIYFSMMHMVILSVMTPLEETIVHTEEIWLHYLRARRKEN